MAIIIPSKRTYEFSNAVVNQNVVSSVEYQISKLTNTKENISVFRKSEDVSDIATFPRIEERPLTLPSYGEQIDLYNYQIFKAFEQVNENSYAYSLAGIKPIYKEYEFLIEVQRSDSSFINLDENSITATINRTVELREREIGIEINGTAPNFLHTAYIANDYETNIKRTIELLQPRRVTNADISYSGTIGYGNNGRVYAKLNWNINQTNDEFQQILDSNTTLKFVRVAQGSQTFGIMVQLRVLCGASVFQGTNLLTSQTAQSTYLPFKLIEYRPINLSIDVYGETYNLMTEEQVYAKSIGELQGERISITNNSLIQNTDYISAKAEELIAKYANGKETAKVRCSIGEYADENGKLVISTKTPDKMLFEHYDKVVPMVRNGEGIDLAMSYTADGLAKVFDVVGVRVFFDGAVWQELTLRESGEGIDIGRTTYTTIANNAGGLTYKITSNEIVTEQNSARGITYIIGE